MAWTVYGNNIGMAVGDFGVKLPSKIKNITAGAQDTFRFTFSDGVGGNEILIKEYTGIANNTIQLEFTAAESALFDVGHYVYALDWYQSGVFMDNIVRFAEFNVYKKAAR